MRVLPIVWKNVLPTKVGFEVWSRSLSTIIRLDGFRVKLRSTPEYSRSFSVLLRN